MHASGEYRCFFPPPPVLRLVPQLNWRERLRTAVEKSGKKHSAIASEDGVDPATLSRILNAHMRPSFETVVRIAHSIGEHVGWLLDEPGYSLSGDEQRQLRKVIRFLDDTLLAAGTHRRQEPNATSAGAADIPRAYTTRGARLVYEASGDVMINAGIADRDVLFVKPTRSTREAGGRVVVCRLDDAEYVRLLDVRAGRIRLLSRNSRYPPIEIADDSTRFELIGIVVGRTGPLGS